MLASKRGQKQSAESTKLRRVMTLLNRRSSNVRHRGIEEMYNRLLNKLGARVPSQYQSTRICVAGFSSSTLCSPISVSQAKFAKSCSSHILQIQCEDCKLAAACAVLKSLSPLLIKAARRTTMRMSPKHKTPELRPPNIYTLQNH
jgi:hypothetical protein